MKNTYLSRENILTEVKVYVTTNWKDLMIIEWQLSCASVHSSFHALHAYDASHLFYCNNRAKKIEFQLALWTRSFCIFTILSLLREIVFQPFHSVWRVKSSGITPSKIYLGTLGSERVLLLALIKLAEMTCLVPWTHQVSAQSENLLVPDDRMAPFSSPDIQDSYVAQLP